MMQIIPDLQKSVEHRKYKAKLIKNNIVYFDIDDVEVKVALVTLDSVQEENQGQKYRHRVASKMAVKMLQN